MNQTHERIDEALRGLGTELDRQAWAHEHADLGRPRPGHQPRRVAAPRRLLAVAAAATVLAGIGGLWAAARDRHPVATVSERTPGTEAPPPSPATGTVGEPAMLLAPIDDDAAIMLVELQRLPGGNAAEAAAITADGVAVGIFVQPRICPVEMGPTCGSMIGTPTFNAGTNVVTGPVGEGDEVADGSRLYLVHGSYFSVTVTAPELSADVRQILAALHETPTGVVIPLPPGAVDLGGGHRSEQIAMRLQVDGRAARLSQTVGVPVGSFLGSLMFGIPTATEVGEIPAWFMVESSAMGGGWGFLAFEEHGTAVLLGLDGGTEEELIGLAGRLTWVAHDDLLETVPAQASPTGSGAPTIEMVASS